MTDGIIGKQDYGLIELVGKGLEPSDIIKRLNEYEGMKPGFCEKHGLTELTLSSLEKDYGIGKRARKDPDTNEENKDRSLRIGYKISPKQCFLDAEKLIDQAQESSEAYQLLEDAHTLSLIGMKMNVPTPYLFDINTDTIVYGIKKDPNKILKLYFLDLYESVRGTKKALPNFIDMTTDLLPGWSKRESELYRLKIRTHWEPEIREDANLLEGIEGKLITTATDRHQFFEDQGTLKSLEEMGVSDMMAQGVNGSYGVDAFRQVDLPEGLRIIVNSCYKEKIQETLAGIDNTQIWLAKAIKKLRLREMGMNGKK